MHVQKFSQLFKCENQRLIILSQQKKLRQKREMSEELTSKDFLKLYAKLSIVGFCQYRIDFWHAAAAKLHNFIGIILKLFRAHELCNRFLRHCEAGSVRRKFCFTHCTLLHWTLYKAINWPFYCLERACVTKFLLGRTFAKLSTTQLFMNLRCS